MSGWVRSWLRAWRSQPLELVSPLPIETVRARLIAGRTSYLRAFFMPGAGGGYVVLGRVGKRRISVEAVKPGVRNSWRPVVRGRLESAGSGCRFVGAIGVTPFIKALCALWIGGLGSFFLGFVAIVVTRAARGEATAADFLTCLVPVGMGSFFVALTAWGMLIDRGEATYLMSWLDDRLQTAGAGIRGYRPWQG